VARRQGALREASSPVARLEASFAGGSVAGGSTAGGSVAGGAVAGGTSAGGSAGGTTFDAGPFDAGPFDAGTVDAGTFSFIAETGLPTTYNLRAVWGAPSSTTFLGGGDFSNFGGAGGLILQRQGSGFRQVAPARTLAIWGSGPNDAWAVGDDVLWRWTGSSWHPSPRAGRGYVALHGTGPNNVYAVGSQAVFRFDGTQWTDARAPNGIYLSVHALSPSDVWVGGAGQLIHFDGTSWVPLANPTGTGNQFNGLWGFAPNNVWAVGGSGAVSELARWNGLLWQSVTIPVGTPALSAIWGAADNDIWAVGGSVLHYDGAAWTTVAVPLNGATLLGVWGTAANDVWAVGTGGAVFHFDGAAWTQVAPTSRVNVTDTWAASATEAFAVGAESIHSTSTGVTREAKPASAATATLTSVHGTTATDVWAVGTAGTVLHRDATGWSVVPSGVTVTLSDVFAITPSDVWVVGQPSSTSSTVLHWDGMAFSPVAMVSMARLNTVWAANAADVWIGGLDLLARWNGTSFVVTPITAGSLWVLSISGTSANEVWAVGGTWTGIGGTIGLNRNTAELRRFNGTSWQAAQLPEVVTSVWVNASGSAFIGGFDGAGSIPR
jgi:hypothetical protein